MSKYDGRGRAKEVLKSAGYKDGGGIKEEKELVKKAVRQHEKHDHKGKKPTNLKLKDGGHIKGEKSKDRLDKMARGGKTKHHKSDTKTKVNVIVAPSAGGAAGQGMPVMPPHPMPAPRPMPMPPQGASPMGPQGAPMPPMKRGGKIKALKNGGEVPMESGAGGGKGRLEKAALARKDGIKPLKKGGKC